MLPNPDLRVHFVNVNHGDGIILELPDYRDGGATASFAVVDFGAKKGVDRGLVRDYLAALIAHRGSDDPGAFRYTIEFACVTHPHDDHYGGLSRFLDRFEDDVRAFWDCGFRTTSLNYNHILQRVTDNPEIAFVRVGSGMEVEYGDTRITVLGPSVDLRNRFDTYGVGKNDASIVLKVKYQNGFAILAADAEYANWAKITEEFPRRRSIQFFTDALGLAERGETSDQLKCGLLKLSHHGSKHGTSLEYLERLEPNHVVVPAGSDAWYASELSNWRGKFPHPLINQTLEELGVDPARIRTSGEAGNLIYRFSGGPSPNVEAVAERADDAAFPAQLAAIL